MKENKYLRKHLHNLVSTEAPVDFNGEGRPLSCLHQNLNSFSRGPYRTYPNSFYKDLALQYIRILNQTSNLHKNETLTELSINNIFFCNGSAQGIDLLIRTYCEPGQDSITVTNPTFPYYGYRAKIEKVNVIDIPLRGKNYDELDIQKILNSRSKLLFLCSPGNPVGSLLKRSQVETLIASFDGLVVIDEAYLEWSNSPSYITLISKYPNLVVLRSFSKIWALAGVRCGAILANRLILKPLEIAQTPVAFPETSQEILLKNFKEVAAVFESKRKGCQIRKELALFFEEMTFVTKIFPSHANFLLVQFDNAQNVYEHLLQDNILVKNVFDQIPNAIRISFGTDKEIQYLKNSLSNYYLKLLKQDVNNYDLASVS